MPLDKGQAEHNRLKADWAIGIGTQVGGLSGPLLRTRRQDFGAQHWSGEVSVLGNRVEYRDLQAQPGLSIDACFTVTPTGWRWNLQQTCTQPVLALEFEAWRFAWDLRQGMTATRGSPDLRSGAQRAGETAAGLGQRRGRLPVLPGAFIRWSGLAGAGRELPRGGRGHLRVHNPAPRAG